MRTVKSIGHLLQPLEDAIHQFLIPALSCSELVRELLSLPCQMGELNIPNPTKNSDIQYSGSRKISAQLASMIELQSSDFIRNLLNPISIDSNFNIVPP